jgi:TonB family protein
MAHRLDILDERDPVALPIFGAILLHAAVAALLFYGWFWMNHARDTLGEMHPGGGPAYAVSAVHNVPIPQQAAPPNPVAHDTQSMVPSAPAKQEVEKKPPPPLKDAVEIPDKPKRQSQQPTHQQQYLQPAPSNQIYTRSPPAVSNPMYSQQSGAGQVGIGPNSPFGNRLGWYAELVRQRIAQSWQTNGLDARSQQQPAMVTFYIMRDGTVRSPQIVQSSGNPSIDNTALRAVYGVGQLPPLPAQITENYISAQFTFNLR